MLLNDLNPLAELDFLSCLPKRVVVNTLETYSEKLGFDYTIDVNNIYDIMFNQWIVFSFLKKDSQYQDTLEMTDKEAAFLLSQMEHFQTFCLSANPFIKHEYYKKTFIRLYDRINRCDSVKQLSHILMIRTKYEQMSYLNILDGNKYQEEAHDIYDLYLNHSLDRKAWMKKMEKLSFSVVILLILFYKRDNQTEWCSWNDIVNDSMEDAFLEVLKSKVKGCSLEEMELMNDVLHQIKLPMIDFY